MTPEELEELKSLAQYDAWLRTQPGEFETSGCKGKQRWPSFAAAAPAGKRIGFKPYHCEFCRGWHLTGPRPWRRRRWPRLTRKRWE